MFHNIFPSVARVGPCADPAINPNDIHISDLAQFSAQLFSAPLGLACLLGAARGERFDVFDR